MSNAFTESERAALLAYHNALKSEIDALIASTEALGDAQLARFRELTTRLSELEEHYRQGVPVAPISRCPFTGDILWHSFDFYGLDGLWWNYEDPVRPLETLPDTYFALTGSVFLSDKLEHVPFLCRPGAASPYVLPRLLSQKSVKAVISYAPVGAHHGFAIAYFADPAPFDVARVNSWGAEHYIFRSPEGKLLRGRAEIEPREADFDLEPWILAGKLLWIAPGDKELALQHAVSGCPYVGLPRGVGFYKIHDGKVWSESPPEQAREEAAAAPPRSPEPAQPQTSAQNIADSRSAFSVRGWFRSMKRRQPGAVMVEPGHVRGLAAALRRARDEKLIPEEKIKAVHRVLQVKDPEDTLWTVGLGSLRWNRFSNGKWEPAEPPEDVELDPQMLGAIVALTEPAAASQTATPSAPPRAAASVASRAIRTK